MESAAVKLEAGNSFILRPATWPQRHWQDALAPPGPNVPGQVDYPRPVLHSLAKATVTYTHDAVAPPAAPKQGMSGTQDPASAPGLGSRSFHTTNIHSNSTPYGVDGEMTFQPRLSPSPRAISYRPALPIVPSQGLSNHQGSSLVDLPRLEPSSTHYSQAPQTPKRKFQANHSAPYPLTPATPKTSRAIPSLSTPGTPSNHFNRGAEPNGIFKRAKVSVSYEANSKVPVSNNPSVLKGLKVDFV
jgi:hypothetical protein